jgi:lipoprotein signal peptidase
MNHNQQQRWVFVLALLALAALFVFLRVVRSHEREQSIPKSLIIHGK